MYLATILDCYGEDYPEAFLDGEGDIRIDVAVRLGETAARVVDWELSMWALADVFEEWMGITITFMDGYGVDDLANLWFEGGASSELGQEEEWPGPSLKTFFNAPVSYTHLRAHETVLDLVCRLLLEKKKKKTTI